MRLVVLAVIAALPSASSAQVASYTYQGQVLSTSGIGAPAVAGNRCELTVNVITFSSLGEPNCAVHMHCLGTTAYSNNAAHCGFDSFSAGLVFRRRITTVQMQDDQGSRQDGSPRLLLNIPRGQAVFSDPPPEPYLSGWGMIVGQFRQQL